MNNILIPIYPTFVEWISCNGCGHDFRPHSPWYTFIDSNKESFFREWLSLKEMCVLCKMKEARINKIESNNRPPVEWSSYDLNKSEKTFEVERELRENTWTPNHVKEKRGKRSKRRKRR